MVKRKLHLSIMPSYYCNYNCNYCYLGKLRKMQKTLDLKVLEKRIKELASEYDISDTVIYGGEVSLLEESYIQSLVNICKINDLVPSFVTNLSNDWLVKYCDDNDFRLSISLNKERPHYKETLNKLKTLNKKNKELSVVVLPSLLKKDPQELMKLYDEIGLDVFFIQYHQSIHSSFYSKLFYNIDINNYSKFLQNIIAEKHKNKYNINIINEIILNDNDYNPLASGFIFINPNGDYMSVEYIDSIEHYKSFQNLNDWKMFCKNEYNRYFNKCTFCDFFGKCKAEHLEVLGKYRKSEDINFDNGECSGLYDLLKWYKTIV